MIRSAKRLQFILILLVAFDLPRASAGDIYIDAGAGVSTLWVAGPTFGLPTMSPLLNITFGAAAAALINLSSDSDPLQFHVGITGRYSSGYDPLTSTVHTLLTPYALLRIDFMNRFYLGFGASVFTWRRSSGAFGFDGFQMTPLQIAALGQVGVEWWVAPFFALNLEGSLETMSIPNGTSLSPLPSIVGLINMRFPLGLIGGGGSGGRSGGGGGGGSRARYDGWRYPFGIGK